ncbi:hypothetical protein D3C80_807570 [compost metagenome]
MFHHPLDGGEEVIHQLLRVDLFLQCAALVVIARITANRGQPVGRQGNKTGFGQTPCDIFDIGVQAAIFMHHHNPRHLALYFGWSHQITTDLTMAPG